MFWPILSTATAAAGMIVAARRGNAAAAVVIGITLIVAFVVFSMGRDD